MPRAKGDPGPPGTICHGKTNDLCFRCDKACGGCSWSKSFAPIPGWTAEPSRICVGIDNFVETWHITDCPEFVGKPPKEKLEKDDINIPLIEAMVRLTRSEMKLSFAKMAEKMHCSGKILQRLEYGNGSSLSADTLMRVAEDLGLDREDIEVIKQ